MFEQKDNEGALFVNEKKTNPNQPDRNGSIRVNGVDLWISGWLKESKGGKKYLSLAVTPKAKSGEAKPKAATPSPSTFIDDEMPDF